MRIVLVHGINQEGKSADIIRDEWMGALRRTCSKEGLADPTIDISRIDAAFYGDTLLALSAGWVAGQTIALGAEEASDDFDEFSVKALEEMALRMGATREDIESEAATTTVALGAGIHKKWVKAIARVIERISPFGGTLAMRFLGQAHAYLRNQHVNSEINRLVEPLFEDDEPMVVIAHSLGTVLCYSLLRKFAERNRPRQVPLLITLGSPLGIDSVRKSFSKPRNRPAGVVRWFNGADPEDFIALQASLTPTTFGSGIENYPDFENGHDDPHSVAAYLSDKRVVLAIAETV
ncbi:hypothetical protein [Methyloversatilis universalis]|nr:hypothetical protein [Methyloversatilis universalis]